VDDLEERIASLAEPVLARHGADLVEVNVKRGPVSLVRVVADRPPGGIDLDTCAQVAEELSRMLDADDPISGRYTLEVGSPGLNRPLQSEDDYRRNLGRRIRVRLEAEQLEGTIEDVMEGSVRLRLGGGPKVGPKAKRDPREGEMVEVTLAEVAKATLILPW
jgi:ribosome maturation factor RimP